MIERERERDRESRESLWRWRSRGGRNFNLWERFKLFKKKKNLRWFSYMFYQNFLESRKVPFLIGFSSSPIFFLNSIRFLQISCHPNTWRKLLSNFLETFTLTEHKIKSTVLHLFCIILYHFHYLQKSLWTNSDRARNF